MKKIIRLTLALALAATAGQGAQAASFGYTDGSCGRDNIFRRGTGKAQGMAIRIGKEKLALLKGCTISAVEFVSGSANAANKKLRVFVGASLTDSPLASDSVSIRKANKWQTATLTSPYTITGNEEELYVGYTATINSTYRMLSADMSADFEGCCYVYNDGTWEDTYGLGVGGVNLRAVIDGAPAYTDLIVKPLSLSGYFKSGTQYEVETQVFNAGTETVSSMDFGYNISGQEGEVYSYTGLALQPGQAKTITLPFVSRTGNRELTLSVNATGVNGDGKEADTSDNQCEASAFFYPESMERMLLVENFTGQDCSNCPAGHATLHQALEQWGLPVASVSHHFGYYPDKFTMDDDTKYSWFYGAGSIYAPAVTVNRTVNPLVGAVPVFGASGLKTGDVLATMTYVQEKTQPYVSLNLETAYDKDSRQLKVKLQILPHTDMPTGQTLFNVFITQDSIRARQSAGGTNYVHNSVFRGTLTGNAWGLLADLKPGQVTTWETTYTLPDSIESDYYSKNNVEYGDTDCPYTQSDPGQMKVVAFVAAYDNSSCLNNPVYNCTVADFGASHTQTGFATAISGVERDAAPAASLRVEGRRIVAGGNVDRMEVFDLQGRQTGAEVGAAGVYIVRLTAGGRTVSRKVTVR